MRSRVANSILFAVSILSPVLCHSEENCPWLNAATGGGVLGGSVTMSVSNSDCSFVLRPGTNKGSLRIEVRTMSDPGKEFPAYIARCGSQSKPLKAIGNEAILCRVEAKSGGLTEQVVGRVRDRAFVILLSLNDSPVTEDLLRERIRKMAELVSGNLF
jgi:hypothetical protein